MTTYNPSSEIQMKIKTKLMINLNATIILTTYMTVEWYEASIKNWLGLSNIPV